MRKLDVDLARHALYTLRRLGHARNRKVDREVRQVTITDDEALALIMYIDALRKLAEGKENG